MLSSKYECVNCGEVCLVDSVEQAVDMRCSYCGCDQFRFLGYYIAHTSH